MRKFIGKWLRKWLGISDIDIDFKVSRAIDKELDKRQKHIPSAKYYLERHEVRAEVAKHLDDIVIAEEVMDDIVERINRKQVKA